MSAEEYAQDLMIDHPKNIFRTKRDIGESTSKIIKGLMSPEAGKASMNPFAQFLAKLGIPIDDSFHNTPKHVVLSSYPTEDGVLYQGIMADAGDDDYAGFEDEMLTFPEEEEEEEVSMYEDTDAQENKLQSMINEIRESLTEASDALHDLTDSYEESRKK